MVKGVKGMNRVQEVSKGCGSFVANKWHRWISSSLVRDLIISSTDLLAKNYLLISLLGGDNDKKVM